MKLTAAVLSMIMVAAPAAADTVAIVATFGNSGATGAQSQSLSLSAFWNEDHNLMMMATASDAGGVKSVSVVGNARVLATCQGATCMYIWDRAQMRAGWNSIEVRYVGSDFATHHAYGQIQQPPAASPTNFLLDGRGDNLLDGNGGKLIAQ